MKVVIATYEHRHGTDIQAFDSLEKPSRGAKRSPASTGMI